MCTPAAFVVICMKENTVMKMISRRDFLKASAVVGAAAAMTACGGSSSSTAASSVASSAAASSTASSAAASGSANVGVCIYQFADNFMTLYRTDLQIDEYRACGINGIHLYALNKYEDVALIAKEAGLIDNV